MEFSFRSACQKDKKYWNTLLEALPCFYFQTTLLGQFHMAFTTWEKSIRNATSLPRASPSFTFAFSHSKGLPVCAIPSNFLVDDYVVVVCAPPTLLLCNRFPSLLGFFVCDATQRKRQSQPMDLEGNDNDRRHDIMHWGDICACVCVGGE